MRINRLGDGGHFERILKENRIIQRAAPLASSSVTTGRIRIVGNEALIVEGSQKVTGWLIVTGTLKLVGSLLMEGQSIFSGGVRLQNLNGNAGAANLTIDGAGNLQRSTFPTEGHIANLIAENATQQASLNDHERRTGGLENRAGNAEARLAGVEGMNGTQQSSLNDHESKVNGLLGMNAALRLNIVSLSLRIQAMDGGGPVTPPPNPGV